MGSISISDKHGLNPSVDHCRFCGESVGVALFGKMKNDVEAPRDVCTGGVCDSCKKVMDAGGIFIFEAEGTEEDPKRTGRMVAVVPEAIHRMLSEPKLIEKILTAGMVYVEKEVFGKLWEKCGDLEWRNEEN